MMPLHVDLCYYFINRSHNQALAGLRETAAVKESEEMIMNDGTQPNSAPNQAPPPNAGIPSSDQMIGDATSVLSSFLKDPVGAVRMAWDQKKIIMALIVAVVLVATELLYSVISMWGVSTFGSILSGWIRSSIYDVVILVLLALAGMLLAGGKSSGGYIGALSGVGVASLPIAVGMLVRTIFLLIAKILPFWLFIQLRNVVNSIFGLPMYVAMFVLLALAIRRMTKSEDDFAIVRNTVLLTAIYYVVAYIISTILWG
ncbi:MAG TPA: hypothetical protein VIL27_03705 [Clostridia bacterium]